MAVILHASPYVPPEWIVAHGLQPQRIFPRAAGRTSRMGSREGGCAYAALTAEALHSSREAAAVIVMTACDQMRRAAALTIRGRRPCFQMHVPATWEDPSARKFYLSELRRLGKFLEKLGGRAPSAARLGRVMARFDAQRRRLMAMRPHLSGRDFARALARFLETSEKICIHPPKKFLSRGVPVALVGGPLLAEQLELFDVVERNGGRVVLDATETGERSLPPPFDSARLRADLLGELADAYFYGVTDVFRRPDRLLLEWLARHTAERKVQAVIGLRQVWCDLWQAEFSILRERLRLPLLDVDLRADRPALSRQTVGRIEAFMETLQ